MIYVWDNGERWSAHDLWFVESDLPSEVVETILNGAPNEKACVLGTAERLTWRDGSACTSLAEWCKARMGKGDHPFPCELDRAPFGVELSFRDCDCRLKVATDLALEHGLLSDEG